MNRNPFAQPTYNSQQPPLPPGPPPPQPAQPDYSAYWAAAAAVQQQAQPAYNAQWAAAPSTAPAAPARPTAEQTALYANYGYGGQQGFQWQAQHQHQQRAPQAPYQPPQPPPPPPPQQYNPYQPQAGAGYAQSYVAQAAPAPPPPPPTVQQPFILPPQQSQQQQQQQQRPFYQQGQRQNQGYRQSSQQQPQHGVQHTPPNHLPPAKRPRHEYHSKGPQQHQAQPPPQPQFQPPPPPPGPMPGQMMQQQGQMGSGSSGYSGRGGGQGGPMGRGGGQGGRGGGGGRGRGGSMGSNRGGPGRGRGGSMYSSGRGGSQGGNQLRSHGSRGNFGGNNRDGSRRGGSFVSGGSGGDRSGSGHHHPQGMNQSYRGRSQGHSHTHNYGRGGRHDGGSGASGVFGSRDGGMMSSSFVSNVGSNSGKKDENRRTLTDFKIVGLEIQDLSWSWGITPSSKVEPIDDAKAAVSSGSEKSSSAQTKDEAADPSKASDISPAPLKADGTDATVIKSEDATGLESNVVTSTANAGQPEAKPLVDMPAPSLLPPPPSRIRIYFHTPVTPDDSQLHGGSAMSFVGAHAPGEVRKGKRKKLEDDDGDLEEGRAPPPPPGGRDDRALSMDVIDRASTAPSVAETASEGDWLMAAIGEDEGDADGGEGDGDLHVSEVVGAHSDEGTDGAYVAESEEYGNYEGEEAHDMSVTEDPLGPAAEHNMGEARGAESVEKDGPQGPSGSNDSSGDPEFLVNGTNGKGVVPHPEQQESVPSVDNAVSSTADGSAVPNGKHSFPPISTPVAPAPSASDDSTSSAASVAALIAPPPEPASLVSAEQPADPPHSHDSQVHAGPVTPSSTPSLSTGDRSLTQEATIRIPSEITNDDLSFDEATQVETQVDDSSPSEANTLVSGGTIISTYGELNQLPMKTEPQTGARVPSANRLSISYAAGMKRLVINAGIVEKLKVFRSEGRIEVYMNIDKDDAGELKGIMIESLSEATKSYVPLEALSRVVDVDPTVPPFSKAAIPSKLTLLVHLNTERPLSEPKWVKTGDVQEWLKSEFGRMFWVAGDAAEGWEKKIEVVDPAPPTIWTTLECWSVDSSAGLLTERQRFLRTHMTETDNILEILLRLVRGERATPFSQSSPISTSISGPLLSAMSEGSAHGAQQTHVSLGVLAIFRMATDYAKRAIGDERGKTEVEERVGEIIRCMPKHLLYKSLDGIFKEWKVEKKGGR